MLGGTRKTDVLDGWTLTTALLARTQRIQIGSMRLVHHWNAARLAQATASAERIAPGRLRFLISIGDRPHDERFGLQRPNAGERVLWLDEMLTAVRGLWRGESVSMNGRFVTLDECAHSTHAARRAHPDLRSRGGARKCSNSSPPTRTAGRSTSHRCPHRVAEASAIARGRLPAAWTQSVGDRTIDVDLHTGTEHRTIRPVRSPNTAA